MMDFRQVKGLRIPEGDVKSISCNGVMLWRCGAWLRELEPGTVVHLLEDGGYEPYIVIAQDHHGEGLTTLLRQYTDGTSQFRSSAPSNEYNNKYPSSALYSAMGNLYEALPETTKALITTVDIPVRSNAYSSSDEVTVASTFFPLSVIELTGEGSSKEGKYISYFSSDALRATTDGTTERVWWTRSVTGGIATTARAVSTDGSQTNVNVTQSRYLRPACCIASDVFVSDTDGEYYIIPE